MYGTCTAMDESNGTFCRHILKMPQLPNLLLVVLKSANVTMCIMHSNNVAQFNSAVNCGYNVSFCIVIAETLVHAP